MGITLSLLLTAAGAILLWAVNVTASGIDIHAVGAILLVVGSSVSYCRCSSGRRGAASVARLPAGRRSSATTSPNRISVSGGPRRRPAARGRTSSASPGKSHPVRKTNGLNIQRSSPRMGEEKPSTGSSWARLERFR